MNTRQKLTLGIAAIFMVTLTIVGVTYAYFVTKVTGAVTESVNVSTVKLGDVVYQTGNGTDDVVTLSNVLPGATVYKTFKVKNENEDTATQSYYNIVTSNWVPYTETQGEGEEMVKNYSPEFIHGNDGSNDGNASFLADCYGYTRGANENTDNINDFTNNYTAATNPLRSNEGGSDLCFDDDSKYNNIKLTLWKISEAEMSNYDNDGKLVEGKSEPAANTALDIESAQITFNDTNELLYKSDNALGIAINGQEVQYYVLKVEYLDTAKNDVTGDDNQNAENEAGINIKVNITA